MIIKNDICYSKLSHDRNCLDIYLPDEKIEKVYIYFHGGGIESGSKGIENIERYLKRNIAVVCPNYRLYPNAKFPQFIEDAAEAAAFIKSNPALVGNCDQIFIGGSSAGGYISMMLYFNSEYLAKHNLLASDFSGFIFDAGQPTTHFNVLRERGNDTRKIVIDESAPLYYVKEYENSPRMLIFVAENDIKCRFEQTKLLISALDHFNYPKDLITYHYMENYSHCGYLKDDIYCDKVCEFILAK